MLKQTAIQNGYTDRKLLEVLDLIKDRLTYLLVMECLCEGHLNEETAKARINALTFDGKPMQNYLQTHSITPDMAYKIIDNTNKNKWDCFYELARRLAD